MVAKRAPSPHEVAQALRTIADELDKRSRPLPDEVAAKLIPLVSGSRVAPSRLLDLLSRPPRNSCAPPTSRSSRRVYEVDAKEAALIRDEIAATRAG
jgi:hypothetical protein